jgi:hypothetical protein
MVVFQLYFDISMVVCFVRIDMAPIEKLLLGINNSYSVYFYIMSMVDGCSWKSKRLD